MDAPVVRPAVLRKVIEVVGFMESEQAPILGGTVRRLLRLDES